MNAEADGAAADLRAVEARLLAWAESSDVPLVRIYFLGPFRAPEFSLAVWLFYGTDLDVELCACDGRTTRMHDELLAMLKDAGYSAAELTKTTFVIDSHENVERNYEGSYFYRLR